MIQLSALLAVLLLLSSGFVQSQDVPRFLRTRGAAEARRAAEKKCVATSFNPGASCLTNAECGGRCTTAPNTRCQSDSDCPPMGGSNIDTCFTSGNCASTSKGCVRFTPMAYRACTNDADCGGRCTDSTTKAGFVCMTNDDCDEGVCNSSGNCQEGATVLFSSTPLPALDTDVKTTETVNPTPAPQASPTPAPITLRPTPAPQVPPTPAPVTPPVDDSVPVPFVKSSCGDTKSSGPSSTTRWFFCYDLRHDQHMDLYVPKTPSASPLKTIMLVHGSLKDNGYDTEDDIKDVCINIVSRSGGTMACATIEYRQSGVTGGSCNMPGKDAYRDQLADVAKALNFLQYYASEYGLDPDDMFIGGHNMGALLANVLNMRFDEFCLGCRPLSGVIGMGGIYDVATWFNYDFDRGAEYRCDTRRKFSYQDNVNTCRDPKYTSISCWSAGSPTYLARYGSSLGLSPSTDNILAIHSSGDTLVPNSQATRFKDALASSAIVSTDGGCGTGKHYEFVSETALADCMINYMASNGTSIV